MNVNEETGKQNINAKCRLMIVNIKKSIVLRPMQLVLVACKM